jgi:hypothetical protein
MSRKPVTRALPSLAEVLPRFSGFAPSVNHTDALAEVLRRVVRQVRERQSRPFYAIREVAAFFRLAPSVVGRVYERLAAEGLLIRKRGSMTLVSGRRDQPRIPVRGVVGLPVDLSGFLTLAHWQQFFIQLEARLRYHHYLADFIFTHKADFTQPEYLDRLLAHELDALFWFFPLPEHRDLVLQAADQGIRVAVLTDRPGRYPGLVYEASRLHALRQGFAEWKRAGIDSVVVARPGVVPPPNTDKEIALAGVGLPYRPEVYDGTGHREYVRRLAASPAAAIVFDEEFPCRDLFFHAPQEMTELVRRRRVLVNPTFRLPFAVEPEVRVDTVARDWAGIARRIADGIALVADRAHEKPVVFHAQWRSRIPANRFTAVTLP